MAPRHHAALQGLKRVEVGIRPQALRLVPPGPDRITGRVFLREPLGLEDEVLVEAVDGTRVKVVTAAQEEYAEGAQVALDFLPENAYFVSPGFKGSKLLWPHVRRRLWEWQILRLEEL